MEFTAKTKENLVTTGIKGLDAQLGGGILPGTTLLLVGDPRNRLLRYLHISSSLVVWQVANVHSTFQQTILYTNSGKNMQRLGIGAGKYEKKDKLLFIDAYTPRFISILPELCKKVSDKELLQKGIDSLNQLKMAIEADYGKNYRGVIDSLSFFLRNYDVNDVSDVVEVMSSIGKMAGGSHLLLMAKGMHGETTENTMKHLADGVIELFFKERGNELERLLVVRKMRGMLTPNKMMPFTIGPKGIDLEVMTRVL